VKSPRSWPPASNQLPGVHENEVRSALVEFHELWNDLFPVEQSRIVELLVQRVDLQPEAIEIALKIEGMISLCSEIRTSTDVPQAAE